MPKTGKWLIHMPNNPGDVVMALFVVDAWKRQYPQAQLHFLTDHECLSLVQNHPQIDKAWCTPRQQIRKAANAEIALHILEDRAGALALENFDGILNLYQGYEGALFLSLIPTRKRIGLCTDQSGEAILLDPASRALFAIPAERSANRFHCIDHYLHMAGLKSKHRPQAQFPPSQIQGIPGAVVLQIGSAWPGKKWPLAYWRDLIQYLLQAQSAPIVLLGSPNEFQENEELAHLHSRIHNYCGKSQLHEIPNLIRGAKLFISGDTFAMHVASALQIPQIALFGPSLARETGPYSSTAWVLSTTHQAGENLEFLNTKILESLHVQDVINTLLGLDTKNILLQAQWSGHHDYQEKLTKSLSPIPQCALRLMHFLKRAQQEPSNSLIHIIEELEKNLAIETHSNYEWEQYRIALKSLNWRKLDSYFAERLELLKQLLTKFDYQKI